MNNIDVGAAGYNCPRFNRCNAGFCPGGLSGLHLPGEPVCFYLLEAVKAGGAGRIQAALRHDLAEGVLRHASELISKPGPLARALRHASETGSRLEQGKLAAARLHRKDAAA